MFQDEKQKLNSLKNVTLPVRQKLKNPFKITFKVPTSSEFIIKSTGDLKDNFVLEK